MDLSYYIIRTLQKYSSPKDNKTTKPLKREALVKIMQKEYPDMSITSKKVRRALDELVNMESILPDEKKTICYRIYYVGEQERKTDYYYHNVLSDVELKYLIDATLYSMIFSSGAARDLAKRIQGLSGKNLLDITSYANESFGRQRYTLENDVMRNVEVIMQAKKMHACITFRWNVYDVEDGKVILKFKNKRKTRPLKLILNNGRYFLLSRQPDSEKVITYSVDLMTEVRMVREKDPGCDDGMPDKNFIRAEYNLQHPFMMGGELRKYKLRVNREYFSRLMDSFSYAIQIIPGTQTEKTVDVRVEASCKGMAYWLLKNYEVAELIENRDEELEKELSGAVEVLYQRYHYTGVV